MVSEQTTGSGASDELCGQGLRVRFGAQRHADFHARWLRHHGSEERHPTTGERTFCSSELPDDLSRLFPICTTR